MGLPELADRLALRRNRSLLSRVRTRVHLGPASPEDTAEYIEYRVRAVSRGNNPFSSDAVAILHEASSGRLRDLDRLATNALRHAASRRVRIVDRTVVGKVLGDHLNDLVALPQSLLLMAVIQPRVPRHVGGGHRALRASAHHRDGDRLSGWRRAARDVHQAP
ncbi:MAG: hypothetical protein R3B40_21165 [Polyangiales bacterium]